MTPGLIQRYNLVMPACISSRSQPLTASNLASVGNSVMFDEWLDMVACEALRRVPAAVASPESLCTPSMPSGTHNFPRFSRQMVSEEPPAVDANDLSIDVLDSRAEPRCETESAAVPADSCGWWGDSALTGPDGKHLLGTLVESRRSGSRGGTVDAVQLPDAVHVTSVSSFAAATDVGVTAFHGPLSTAAQPPSISKSAEAGSRAQ